MALAGIAIGILFILYFIAIEFFAGHGSNFYFTWLFMGVVSLAWGVCLRKGLFHTFPAWLKRGTGILFLIGLVCFLAVEGLIIGSFWAKGEKGLDYIIVLGAQLKDDGPSRVLRLRLDTAYEYLEDNPGTLVIVSGGQGSNEPDTEAQGMYDYLTGKGVEPGRIIREGRSTNTAQNIAYSGSLLDKETDRVGVVTNNFHVFRAVGIARAAGYRNVSGIAAPAYIFLQPNNMLREFFGVVKDFVFGNL